MYLRPERRSIGERALFLRPVPWALLTVPLQGDGKAIFSPERARYSSPEQREVSAQALKGRDKSLASVGFVPRAGELTSVALRRGRTPRFSSEEEGILRTFT